MDFEDAVLACQATMDAGLGQELEGNQNLQSSYDDSWSQSHPTLKIENFDNSCYDDSFQGLLIF